MFISNSVESKTFTNLLILFAGVRQEILLNKENQISMIKDLILANIIKHEYGTISKDQMDDVLRRIYNNKLVSPLLKSTIENYIEGFTSIMTIKEHLLDSYEYIN